MVTAEAVWGALDEIPDPEIPVISLVDLGVIRDVAVVGGRVHVEFTPTFLGCPALEVMLDVSELKYCDDAVTVAYDSHQATRRVGVSRRYIPSRAPSNTG